MKNPATKDLVSNPFSFPLCCCISVVRFRLAKLFPLVLLALWPALANGQADERAKSWNLPVKPFRLIGNIYYVGASDVTSFLITTPQGHILLDSGLAETVPLIKDNLKQLGFKLTDIKILINSHAHYDHAGGLAELKELTGARVMASEADAALLARGGRGDFQWGDKLAYRPVKADRILRDGDKVELGGVTMVARLTPGHTMGCTTWTMKVSDAGRLLDVVFVGSTTIPGYRLTNNSNYPNIVADYARSFQLLKTLPCDVFLGPHGAFFSLKEKMQRLAEGAGQNPFIDPQGFRDYIEQTEAAYREQLQRERRGEGPR
jgi:metallo-beta-lactamase class B